MKFLLDSDSWQEVYGSIRKNKVRTIITVIGVFWGILLLIGLLGAARGLENGFKKLFGDFATNSVFLWTQATDKPFKGYQKGRSFNLTFRDIGILERAYKDQIKILAPRNQTSGLLVRNFKTGDFKISGDYPILDKIEKKELIYGRFLNKNDIDQTKKICVISEDIYKQFFDKGEDPIGEFLKISQVNYKIVGVYKLSDKINLDGNTVYIPFTTYQKVYNTGNTIDWITVTAKAGIDIEEMEENIIITLKNLHKVHPEDKRAFGSFNLGTRIDKLNGFLKGMQFLTWFVGIATLIAGVFAIGNILLITVKERTKEIGIRRAIGATPMSIRRQVILESVFLTSIAGMIGIIFGVLILVVLDFVWGRGPDAALVNPTVDIPIVAIALGVLVILGTVIGLIPAYKSTLVRPIEALREE